VPARLLRVVGDDLPEVLRRSQAVRRQDPDLDEVVEVAEAVELAQPLDGRRGQREVVAASNFEQRLGPNRRLEVDVQLDLRKRRFRQKSEPSNAASPIVPRRVQRFSK
jgi:hypothetical protein